ncbi:MAG: peptidoglycan bridge formation glycyltransferase FemA/FemB family protein [Chloroflexi bacterium]|nr:peptidoglycan bridge formation glycyltransferase FemA/FemB family protein [Chloroflexota bacterium]
MRETLKRSRYLIQETVDHLEWDEFVRQHPQKNIFQTPQMYDVYQRTKNYEPIKLFAIEQKTHLLCGVLSAVMMREVGGPLGMFATHSVVQGGPLATEDTDGLVLPLLMAEHDRRIKRKALYSEIRNMHNVNQTLENVKHYEYEDHLNFLIRLDQSEDELWKQIHRARRKNINRAIRQGVEIEEIHDKRLLEVFYGLLRETYASVGIPLAHTTLFEAAFDTLYPVDMAKFLLAKHNGKHIGARVVLLFNGAVYDWYAGASQQSLDLYPNDLLVWHVLRWGAKNGYKQFDFGGAGKPDVEYGPREFKRRFGGSLVNYGRHVRVYAPTKIAIAKVGLKFYQKLYSSSKMKTRLCM